MGEEPARHRGCPHGLVADARRAGSSGVTLVALKALGKGVDAVRPATMKRKHDVVIVPGMGVLDASLPLRAWGFPYTLFLASASGRLLRTKVAMVSVGGDIVHQRSTRWLLKTAARLAFFRSFRDAYSRDAMRRSGLDVTLDPVYPDLVSAYLLAATWHRRRSQ